MKSKDYQGVLDSLEEGLVELRRESIETKTSWEYEKLSRQIEIQKAKIEFFKKGYNFCRRELIQQRRLVGVIRK